MQYRRLGQTGLKVSEISLGTLNFGSTVCEVRAIELVDLALSKGINLIDTANTYAGGVSEEILGRALGRRRSRVLVATKFSESIGSGPNDAGTSRAHIMRAVEDSLSRLRTDYIDLYYVHHVDVEGNTEEMLRGLDDLVHSGKVRYIGCSNYDAWRLCDALWVSDSRNLARFEVYQPQYSLLVRDIEQELLPLCLAKGVGVACWSPLAGGCLCGKHSTGQSELPSASSERETWLKPYFSANAPEIVAEVRRASIELERSPTQISLRWLLQQNGIATAIVGASDIEQLTESVRAAEWHMDPSVLHRLTEVSNLATRYPRSFEAAVQERRASAVGAQVAGTVNL